MRLWQGMEDEQPDQAYFRALFETAGVGVALLRREDGIFVFSNPAYCEIVGYSEEELRKLSFRDITHPDDLTTHEQAEELRSGRIGPLFLERRYIRKDGGAVWVRLSISHLSPSGGAAEFVVVVAANITEERLAREMLDRRLRELAALNSLGKQIGGGLSLSFVTEAALRTVVELSMADLAVLFLREDGELRLQGTAPPHTCWSRDAVPIHKVGECLCGMAVSTEAPLYSRDIHLDPRCTWEECKRAGLRSFAALPLKNVKGVRGILGLASAKERDFESQAPFLETVAEQVAAALRNADLYEQLRLQAEELEKRVEERTAELEAKNRELETFTYSVSHDLKAPLRGIDGYSRLLLDDYGELLPEEGREFLSHIREATEQMSRLIDDLLAYSRFERRTLAIRPVNLGAIVAAVLGERRDEIQERAVALEVHIDCPPVVADADGLAMALRNLLDNALKFTRHTPSPRIVIEARRRQHGCLLRISDNGIGFDMKFHDRIFDIFERLHGPEDYPGTGVGLAIVRRAMERMGGRVWAESAPEKGTHFWIDLPEATP